MSPAREKGRRRRYGNILYAVPDFTFLGLLVLLLIRNFRCEGITRMLVVPEHGTHVALFMVFKGVFKVSFRSFLVCFAVF